MACSFLLWIVPGNRRGGGWVQDDRAPVPHLGEEDDALDWVRTVDSGQRTEVGRDSKGRRELPGWDCREAAAGDSSAFWLHQGGEASAELGPGSGKEQCLGSGLSPHKPPAGGSAQPEP